MSVKDKLNKSEFSKFNDSKSRNSINTTIYDNVEIEFSNLLNAMDNEKQPQSDLKAYKLVNKFFWKVFGVNFVYSQRLNNKIKTYNNEQDAIKAVERCKAFYQEAWNSHYTGKTEWINVC